MSYEEIRASYPKGRKAYVCEWCAQYINKGEKHFYRYYIFEGDRNEGRMHLECEKAMDKSPSEMVSEGWMPGKQERGEPLS